MSVVQKIGRYEILEELGRGAMGSVYRARDPSMDRIVALKTIISTALAGEHGIEFRERFFREARAAGALAHPGIVPVFDVGEHEGQPFLVMEYVDGWTLANISGSGERLDVARMSEIGQRIAEALGYAHQRGVIHRDIKPANIMLTSRKTYGVERPKITDFGIAKLTEGEATMTGKMLGTPAFMPPEQFTGAQVDGRADLFSLGVVLYWMATGEQPFPGEGLTTVLYKVVHTEPIPPRKLNPALPVKFENIILKCMQKDPAARYQTGEELALELGELRMSTSAPSSPAIPRATVPVNWDSDATLIVPSASAPSSTEVSVPTQVPVQTVAAAPVAATQAVSPIQTLAAPASASKRGGKAGLIAGAMVAVIVAASWFGWHSRQTQSTPATTESVPATVPPPAAPTSPSPSAAASPAPPSNPAPPAVVASKPDVTNASPSVAKVAAVAPTAKVSAKPATAKAPPVAPTVAVLDFNPLTLNPKENARLKIDGAGMPKGLDFTIEMNGKVYGRLSGGAGQDSFVPPGVHDFRVSAKSATVQQASNTVSIDFLAKKKYTLKVELRIKGQPASAGMPQGLYPDSQIVITLK